MIHLGITFWSTRFDIRLTTFHYNLEVHYHVQAFMTIILTGLVTLISKPWRSPVFIHTYVPLTLYPRRNVRDFSDIPPRRPCYTKTTSLLNEDVTILQTWQAVSPSPFDRSHRCKCYWSFSRLLQPRKKARGVILYFVPDTTRDQFLSILLRHQLIVLGLP
jgi:hypothetical protein